MNRRFFSLLLMLVGTLPGLAQAAPVMTPEVEAELHSQTLTWQPGENWLALRLRPQPGYHVYWINPGDSGIPTKLQWTLPDNVTAGEIHWPYPHPESLGDLTNYGYSDETLLMVPLTVPADAHGQMTLAVTASWLACKDICVPGKAELSLTRAVRAPPAQPDPDWADAFAHARSQWPQVAHDWPARFSLDDTAVSIELHSPELKSAQSVLFFPYQNDLVNHGAAQRQALQDDGLRLTQALSPYFSEAPQTVDGVVVISGGGITRAYEISARPGTVLPVSASTPAAAAMTTPATPPAAAATTAPPAFALVLLFALLGGLILNLMPCVFPVLSLKALSLINGDRDDARARQRQTYAYTAGVVLSCVAVAAVMLALRGAGAAIGWGFQLQSPVFVALMAYVLFALGLSLSGAVQFGTRLMNLGGGLAQQPGLRGAFFTGVLAVVVASPCTAPFMGSAMGYAMTQPAWVALLVFALLGLGLALPFLLIGWFPRLARALPRPGAWMETFKQLMAFPLYLSVVWLLWVLVRQTDAQMLAQAMLGLVTLAFALWLWHRTGWIARLGKSAALILALALAATLTPAPATTVDARAESQVWSAARVAELRAQERTVFVDFTADWCISCKVNERVALQSSRVQQAFAEHQVAFLVADWTRTDPAITEELARFGRNGVPLYLVYPKGADPKILPQLLTPDLVIRALTP